EPLTYCALAHSECSGDVFLFPSLLIQFPGTHPSSFSPILWRYRFLAHTSFDRHFVFALYIFRLRSIKAKALFTEIEKIVMSDPEKFTFTVPDRKTIQRNLDSLEYERLRKRRKKVKELAEKLESELIGLKDKDPNLVAEVMHRLQGIEKSDK